MTTTASIMFFNKSVTGFCGCMDNFSSPNELHVQADLDLGSPNL